MKCDLKCPFDWRPVLCCRNCHNSRRKLKDLYPDKWTNEFGFGSVNGCKLGNDKPQECKDYDCKQYIFYYKMTYVNGKWITVGLYEIPREKQDKEFIDKYNAIFKDLE